EVARRVDQAAAYEGEVVVVRRDTLEDPQLARIRLVREVVADECGRLDALHVPRVQVLVAGKPEEAQIVVVDRRRGRLGFRARAGKLAARADEARRGAVFEAAVPVVGCADEKEIALERGLRASAAEELDLPSAHARDIVGQAADGDAARSADR